MAQINSRLGAKAGAYGWYGQIRESTFDGSQFLAVKMDVVASGAVFVASVMPSVNFNQVTPEKAQQVAAVMKQFTDDGVEVWLRFAHEMNWYVQDNPDKTKTTYHGTAPDFITAWKNIYEANCKGNAKVKCFWSPNRAGNMKDLEPYWPGPEYVDIVGIDCYPKGEESIDGLFDKMYGAFYDTFSKPYDLPFAIGETGAGGSQKEAWLKQLVSQDQAKYPNYVSMSWFEYDKEADFRIVMTDDAMLAKTKQILLSGGDGTCAGGVGNGDGNGTVPVTTPTLSEGTGPSNTAPVSKPTETVPDSEPTQTGKCDWGCLGWDCSATVPCQDPFTCKGGYCKK
jgi:hypothetical protein